MIIGLCGAAQSGKNTVADFISESYYTKQIQIAGLLKKYCRDLFGWTLDHTDGALKDVPDTRYPLKKGVHVWTGHVPSVNGVMFTCDCGAKVHASEIIPPGECIRYLTPRMAMQQLGGEFARSTFPSIYAARAVRLAQEAHGSRNGDFAYMHAVITDCRFLSDLQAVKDAGGVIINVRRGGSVGLKGDAAAHMSETERLSDDFLELIDLHIDNDGTRAELQELTHDIITDLMVLDAQPL